MHVGTGQACADGPLSSLLMAVLERMWPQRAELGSMRGSLDKSG